MPNDRMMEPAAWADYQAVIGREGSGKPSNHQNRSLDQIEKAAAVALGQGLGAREVLAGAGITIENKVVLEIGPGHNFGPALVMAEDSARLILADLYMPPWQQVYHSQFYRLMREKLGRPHTRLDAIIANEGYEGAIDVLWESSFDLKSVAHQSVDLVYSNAVLEHVEPLAKAISEFFRVTKPGGYGVHQIDFRYHRTFDRPLEYLLLSRDEFSRFHQRTFGEIGCQTRPAEVATMFQEAGFIINRIENNMSATNDYLSDFLPRLKNSPVSEYRDWAASELSTISACFFVQRP